MSQDPVLKRKDLLKEQAHEWFKVPAFTPTKTLGQRLLLRLRHLLDPAAASIWQDLSVLLQSAQGDFLDVGCGAQPYRGLMPAELRYQGIDRMESKDVFGYSIPDTLYYEGDRWPISDASMDTILCTEVLEHVEDPGRFLEEVRRCLKPGGRVIFTVPFSARVHYSPHDYRRYTQFGLRSVLEKAGLFDVKVWGRGNPLSVACSKVLGLVFPLLQKRGALRLPSLLLALLLSPLVVFAGPLSYLTLGWEFGDDFIGFTAVAKK